VTDVGNRSFRDFQNYFFGDYTPDIEGILNEEQQTSVNFLEYLFERPVESGDIIFNPEMISKHSHPAVTSRREEQPKIIVGFPGADMIEENQNTVGNNFSAAVFHENYHIDQFLGKNIPKFHDGAEPVVEAYAYFATLLYTDSLEDQEVRDSLNNALEDARYGEDIKTHLNDIFSCYDSLNGDIEDIHYILTEREAKDIEHHLEDFVDSNLLHS